MHLATRSKVSILLSTVTLLGIVGALLVTFISHNAPTHAAAAATTAQYHGTASTVTNYATSTPTKNHRKAQNHGKHMIPRRSLARSATANTLKPGTSDGGVTTVEGKLVHNFNGLSDINQAAVNGGPGVGELTPPDQGLCIGIDPGVSGKVVFEPVNSAIRETSVDGTALSGHPLLGNMDVSFANFWEPGAFSDPRCFYDRATQTFFFTVIGTLQSGPDAGNTSIDVAVYNAHGFAVYQIDSSFGATFFGDQPHVGYDSNNLYLSTDEFNVAGTAYFGAALFAVSKSQLIAEANSVALVTFGPLSLAGIPILTLQPAVSTPSSDTEYLLNSFPFADADITPNPISHQLGYWTVIHGAGVSNGHPNNVILTGTIIHSETYGFPVNAVSTGTGITDANGITSEAFLNPDDSRMQQVQFIDGHLWAALTTAISIKSDPVARDGIAWFNIDVNTGSVSTQGYIAVAGAYLIYPAILHTDENTTAITFTLTSATINPSAAYVVRKSTASSFGTVRIAAAGHGPHLSFSDTLPVGGRPRWGDYSAAVLDPTNLSNIWLATEYIPAPVNQDPFDNWGTRVFDTQGDN